ncbi:peptidase M23 [Actinomycetales bacterium SN12]|nr:peptidase M23 [Actinomycetales bacterium SN12]
MNEDITADARSAGADCGCAPTPAEREALWSRSKLTRRSALTVGVLSAVALSAFGVSANTQTAQAAGYPSWDDVQRAKANEAAKASEITRIEALIQQLTDEAAAAEAAARKAGDEFYAAQQAYFDQAAKADDLQAQADEQAQIAADSARKAGQVANQLYRSGGDETALELFLSESSNGADDLLARLGSMDKLVEYNRTVAERAASARDTAQSLSNQASTARDERDRLQKIAEEKMQAAQRAADAAQAALEERQSNLVTLQAQLAALKDNTTATVAGYQEGERIRKEEEARRRAEEAERARRAAEEAAKNHQSGGGGGGGGASSSGGGGGGTGGSGSGAWRRPHGGHISSHFGPRPPVCTGGVCRSTTHGGTDFANGCGAPIYAASSGRVDAAFYNSGFGNWVRIQHGGGIATSYAHMSGYAVSNGQQVSAGQLVGYAGNTGASQGCHLHFEVYINGGRTNPYNFLAARGAI